MPILVHTASAGDGQGGFHAHGTNGFHRGFPIDKNSPLTTSGYDDWLPQQQPPPAPPPIAAPARASRTRKPTPAKAGKPGKATPAAKAGRRRAAKPTPPVKVRPPKKGEHTGRAVTLCAKCGGDVSSFPIAGPDVIVGTGWCLKCVAPPEGE